MFIGLSAEGLRMLEQERVKLLFGPYHLMQSHVNWLPKPGKEEQLPDGATIQRCLHTRHFLRATTVSALPDAGEDLRKVQELLGHRLVITTQIYDKRRRRTHEGASHDILN
jgi:hypothetical protein